MVHRVIFKELILFRINCSASRSN